MFKVVLLAFIPICLTACGTSTMQYRSINTGIFDKNREILIKSDQKIQPGFWGTDVSVDVTLYINGSKVISGPLNKDFAGKLTTNYEEQLLVLECLRPNIFSQANCTVHLGNKLINESKLQISH